MAYTPMKTIKQLLEGLLEAMQGIKVLESARGILADIRVNITGGTVNTVTTVGTVNGVSNQSNMGGYAANQQIPALQNLVAISSNINNIKIT